MQKKRILAALLSAAMVVTSAAVPVFADELDEAAPDEVETVEAEMDDAIELTEDPVWNGEGEGTEDEPYLIKTEKDLQNVDDFNAIEGKFFRLENDITLKNQWSNNIEFKGTLDGANHKISGIYVNGGVYALFNANSGTIKDLTIEGEVSGSSTYTTGFGGLVRENSGTIDNCTNYCNINLVGPSLSAQEGHGAGGIAAVNKRGATIKNCKNYGDVSFDKATKSWFFTGGGIAGSNYGTIESCDNHGKVYIANENNYNLYLGGIAGNNGNHKNAVQEGGTITKCRNYGDIGAAFSGRSPNVGGIAGLLNTSSEVSNCLNIGSVSTTNTQSAKTGGIVGTMSSGDFGKVTLTGNANAGKVTAAEGTYYGAIAGQVYDPETWGSSKNLIVANNTYLSNTSDVPYHYSPRTGFTVTAPTEEMLEAEEGSVKPISFDEMDKEVGFKPAEKVEVKLVGGAGGVYDIVLNGVGGTKINRFMSAELNFTFAQTEGSVGFEVVPNEDLHINMIKPENPAEDGVSGVYEFNLDGSKNEAAEGEEASYNADITNLNITLGKIVLTGHGKGTITVEGTGSIVNTAEAEDNIVDHYTAEDTADPTLILPEEVPVEVSLEMGDIQVYVMFPNKIDNIRTVTSDYNQMKVTIDSAVFDGELITVDLGTVSNNIKIPEALTASGLASGGNFSNTREQNLLEGTEKYKCYSFYVRVPANFSYTLTFSGEGYRTYSVDTVAKPGSIGGNSCTTVYVWNNAMDDPEAVVTYMDDDSPHDEHMVKQAANGTTFLAGDIVEDHDINLYDLSAVVAYFGKDGLYTNDLDEHKYVKYDLNRDGQIDSKDIAMVLVSWGY